MRKSRILVIAVPAIVLLVGMVLYEYAYLGVRAEIAAIKEQQEAKTRTLTKYIAVIAEKPELEKKLASLKEQAKADSIKFIDGEPVSLASANLQETVKGILTGRGATISSERIGKAEDFGAQPETGEAAPHKDAGAQKGKGAPGKKGEKAEAGPSIKVISVSLDASVPDPGALSDILYSVETRTPYLVIKELDARVKNFKEPRDLMVKIDVSGLYGGK